jgi:hypothetical protein
MQITGSPVVKLRFSAESEWILLFLCCEQRSYYLGWVYFLNMHPALFNSCRDWAPCHRKVAPVSAKDRSGSNHPITNGVEIPSLHSHWREYDETRGLNKISPLVMEKSECIDGIAVSGITVNHRRCFTLNLKLISHVRLLPSLHWHRRTQEGNTDLHQLPVYLSTGLNSQLSWE